MSREEKLEKDRETLEAYKVKLKTERKLYGQVAKAVAVNNRRSRALALGECCMRILEEVNTLKQSHLLLPGTLAYMIEESMEHVAKDRKLFTEQVMYQVMADEPAYTEEEIAEKAEQLRKQLATETEEMYPAEDPPWEEEDSSLRSE